MKFSWRANWEILLVLVIIVVGIVITTIAAIRNKDKNPQLVLAEEADFGQLLAGANGGGYVETVTTSKQLNEDVADAENEQPATRRPLLQAMLKTSARPFHHTHHHHHQVAANRGSYHAETERIRVPAPSNKYEEPNLSEYNRLHTHSMPLGDKNLATTGPTQQQDLGNNLESYDAMSTEPTPSQSLNQFSGNQAASDLSGSRGLNGARRGFQQEQLNRTSSHLSDYGDQMSESVDLIDDIHTTKSSLAGGNVPDASYTGSAGVLQQQQLDHNRMPMTPSLALYAPYGVTPTTLQQLLSPPHHAHNHKQLETQPMDADDMMTSYTKLPPTSASGVGNSSNLTEAMLRDYNLASATFGGQPVAAANSSSAAIAAAAAAAQQSQAQLIHTAMLANLMGSMPSGSESAADIAPYGLQHAKLSPALSTHHRAFSAALPISMLLADILKLTKPHAGSGGEPAGGRISILQQLRSSPSSLLALLQQGFSQSNQSNMGDMANHDASESSQHYHRVSMSPTDIHSIIARSLSSSSVLPAFPAPKGVHQSWVPPTSGGPEDYHVAENSNADFVASNVAGFVRLAEQQPNAVDKAATYHTQQQLQSGGQEQGYQRAGTNEQSSDNNNNMHASGNNLLNQAGQIANNEPAIYPANHAPAQNMDRSWPQQQQQQQASFGSLASAGNNRQQSKMMTGNEGGLQSQQQRTLKATNNNMMAQSGKILDYVPPYNMNMNNFKQQTSMKNNHQQQFNGGQVALHNMPFNHNPSYNHLAAQQQPMAQIRSFNPQARAFGGSDFGGGPVESAPKISIAHSNQAAQSKLPVAGTVNGNRNGRQIMGGHQLAIIAPAMGGNHQHQRQNLASAASVTATGSGSKNLVRRRRSSGLIQAEEGRMDEVMSGKYLGEGGDGDDDDDSDAQPISVVKPDGEPTNSGRVRGFPSINGAPHKQRSQRGRIGIETHPEASDRQVAQSQRQANHMRQESHEYPSEHYMSLYGGGSGRQSGKGSHLHSTASLFKGPHNELEQQRYPQSTTRAYKDAKKAFGGLRKNRKHSVPIETAGSGLMSKLLGTASTTDETEEDADDADDDANEKRKEEIEDAEFGIVNDERHLRPTTATSGEVSGGDAHPPTSEGIVNSVDGANGNGRASDDASLSSGSNDNEAYARRNQPRSDIEFYGHPGEETRTLKYGILGSGNYEVVNGGIYPETDESTAAVNSVANYVRKPGGLLVNSLPKLLADHSQNGPQSSYMAGARLAGGGYMRGASANPDGELVGLVPSGQLAKDPMGNPMLELIDANSAQLFDPNMMTHLGSSARTTHAARDSFEEDEGYQSERPSVSASHTTTKHRLAGNKGPEDSVSLKSMKRKKTSGKRNNANNNNKFDSSTSDHNELDHQAGDGMHIMDDDLEAGGGSQPMQKQQSSISGARSHGTNQFNSYQILPSKKVTIFSDQDLDSAPSELHEQSVHHNSVYW